MVLAHRWEGQRKRVPRMTIRMDKTIFPLLL
jgi:hypothetical protein